MRAKYLYGPLGLIRAKLLANEANAYGQHCGIAHHHLLRVVKHASDTSRNLINKLISNDAILTFFFFLYLKFLHYTCTCVLLTTVYGYGYGNSIVHILGISLCLYESKDIRVLISLRV